MKNIKRLVAMILLALAIATTAGATLPPTNPSEGPYACYRIWYYDKWYFLGYYWEDISHNWGIDVVECFYRY